MKHLTAAVQDAVLATGISAWDGRYNAEVLRTTCALRALFQRAILRGELDEIVAGYFKLSAREPHRLVKLVDSIVLLRLPDVSAALIRYNDEN